MKFTVRLLASLLAFFLCSALAAHAEDKYIQVIFPEGTTKKYLAPQNGWVKDVENFAQGKKDGTLRVKFTGPGAPAPWKIVKKGDTIQTDMGGKDSSLSTKAFVDAFESGMHHK